MNKLRQIFSKEIREEDKQRLNKMIEELKDEKNCRFCTHAKIIEHYGMGRYGGTDVYCPIFNELRLLETDGQQCLFWDGK